MRTAMVMALTLGACSRAAAPPPPPMANRGEATAPACAPELLRQVLGEWSPSP